MTLPISIPHASKPAVAKQPAKRKAVYTETVQDLPLDVVNHFKKKGLDLSQGNTRIRTIFENGDMSSLGNRKNHFSNYDCFYNKNKNEATFVYFNSKGKTYQTEKDKNGSCFLYEMRKTKDVN